MRNCSGPVRNAPNAPLGNITSIVRLRVNSDGEGVRTVVFLYGCPLNCIWCCNPETRFGGRCKLTTPLELYRLILRDIPYFRLSKGGVTFSGGEPLLQYPFIREFARLVNGAFSINVETSLFADAHVITELAPLIQHWYVDYKGDRKHHMRYTGVDSDQIRQNLRYLSSVLEPGQITLTVPLIPSYTVTDTSISELIALTSELGVTQVELHPHRSGSAEKYKKLNLPWENIAPLDSGAYEHVKEVLRSAGLTVASDPPVIERKKCDYLKRIRRDLCERYQIPVSISECKFEGRCAGTCPKCEKELSEINDWLKTHSVELRKESHYAAD